MLAYCAALAKTGIGHHAVGRATAGRLTSLRKTAAAVAAAQSGTTPDKSDNEKRCYSCPLPNAHRRCAGSAAYGSWECGGCFMALMPPWHGARARNTRPAGPDLTIPGELSPLSASGASRERMLM